MADTHKTPTLFQSLIPIFSIAGEPYNKLLARIGIRANADTRIEGNTDANTLVVDASANAVAIKKSAASYSLDVGGNFNADQGARINNTGIDSDTIIEGDTDNELFLVNAGTDRVGISTGTPGALFAVRSNDETEMAMRVLGEVDSSGDEALLTLATSTAYASMGDVTPILEITTDSTTVRGGAYWDATLDGVWWFGKRFMGGLLDLAISIQNS